MKERKIHITSLHPSVSTPTSLSFSPMIFSRSPTTLVLCGRGREARLTDGRVDGSFSSFSSREKLLTSLSFSFCLDLLFVLLLWAQYIKQERLWVNLSYLSLSVLCHPSMTLQPFGGDPSSRISSVCHTKPSLSWGSRWGRNFSGPRLSFSLSPSPYALAMD